MKKIALALIILINLTQLYAKTETVDGSIVVIGNDCMIDLHDNQNSISYVIIINAEDIIISEMSGCLESTCHINLAHLPSGIYTVKVQSTSGYSFSSAVVIN